MSIQSEITRLNTEVAAQADLIAQIQSALEDKASGGGGYTGEEAIETIALSGTVGQGSSASATFSGAGKLFGYQFMGTLKHSYINSTEYSISVYQNIMPLGNSRLSQVLSTGGAVNLTYSGNTMTVTVTAPTNGANVLMSGTFKFHYIK